MKINQINSLNCMGKGIIVSPKLNPKNEYLYNQVSKIVNDNNVTATFSNEGIVFSSVTDKILNSLKMLGIKYSDKK